MSEIDPIEFGALREQVKTLSDAVDRLDTAVDRLTDAISQSKGGWKMLATIGTLVAAAASAGTWFVSHVKFTP